jgi:hypothetical protein
MNGKPTTFVHALLFRCQKCTQPLSLGILSTERSSEKIDGDSFDLLCQCGWSKSLLGMQATRHWVTPWLNADGEDPEAT